MINNARRQHRGNRRPGRMARDSSALGTLSPSPTLGVRPILHLCLSLSPTPPLLPCRIPFPRNSLCRCRVHKWTSTGAICHGANSTEFTTRCDRRGQHTETCRRTRE